jgi:hypothetical protein
LISVQNTLSVCAYKEAAKYARVAGNLQDQAPLVLVVVYSHPGARLVDGAENAGLSA